MGSVCPHGYDTNVSQNDDAPPTEAFRATDWVANLGLDVLTLDELTARGSITDPEMNSADLWPGAQAISNSTTDARTARAHSSALDT